MAKCNEIISYNDNDIEYKGSRPAVQILKKNLHCKHPVLQYNTHHAYAMWTLLSLT